MEKDADSMVVKPVEYASSEYSASSEPPPVSKSFATLESSEKSEKKHENAIKNFGWWAARWGLASADFYDALKYKTHRKMALETSL